MAESAVRAGYMVVTVDAYADLDLATIADAHLVSPYGARAAVCVADRLLGHPVRTRDVVCYVSNLENHPAALRQLARGRVLWGNSARTVTAARTPERLARALAVSHLPAPRVRAAAPRDGSPDSARRWLLKPRASGGGHGIVPWRPGAVVPRRSVLQERIGGQPASITFVADGRRCVPIALTRQLVGDRRFGATAYRYCGNLLAPPDDARWGRDTTLWTAAVTAAAAVTRAFGLVGLNGLDFIVQRGRSVPIEVNPRYTAAMELAERRDGFSTFMAHVAGCSRSLATLSPPPPGTRAAGKALVFARAPLSVGETASWLADPDIRDVPRPGTHIAAGTPICTVFATAATVVECEAQLVAKANDVYRVVDPWRTVAPTTEVGLPSDQ